MTRPTTPDFVPYYVKGINLLSKFDHLIPKIVDGYTQEYKQRALSLTTPYINPNISQINDKPLVLNPITVDKSVVKPISSKKVKKQSQIKSYIAKNKERTKNGKFKKKE
jgi:hypothetical protein